eukprot:2436656-Pleurochrysis_carterae.AAC.1
MGTARVPLSALLRRGSEKRGHASTVREYVSADVVATALTSIDAAPLVDPLAPSPPQLRGTLKLVLARLSVGGGARARNADGG